MSQENDLDQDQKSRLVAWAQRLADYHETQIGAASAIGMPQQSLNRLLRGSAGYSVAKKIAAAYAVNVNDLIDGRADLETAFAAYAARVPAKPAVKRAAPSAAARAHEYLERYPNRAIAVQMARTSGYPEEAIRPVLAMVLDSDDDPTSEVWFEHIKYKRLGLKGKIKEPIIVAPERHSFQDRIDETMAMSDEQIAEERRRNRR